MFAGRKLRRDGLVVATNSQVIAQGGAEVTPALGYTVADALPAARLLARFSHFLGAQLLAFQQFSRVDQRQFLQLLKIGRASCRERVESWVVTEASEEKRVEQQRRNQWREVSREYTSRG